MQAGCQSIAKALVRSCRLQHAAQHGGGLPPMAAATLGLLAAAAAARACALPLTPRNTSCSLPFFLSAFCAMATVFRPAARAFVRQSGQLL